MKTAPNSQNLKVVHIMRDGEVRTSIEGLTPPPETGCYDILRIVLERKEKE